VGTKVVNASGKVEQVAADQVQLDMVEGAGAGRRPEIHLASWNNPSLGDARRIMEKRCQVASARHMLFRHIGRRSQGHERRHPTAREVSRQLFPCQAWIDLEGHRLVVPVQVMSRVVNAMPGVFSAVVVLPGSLNITVRQAFTPIPGKASPLAKSGGGVAATDRTPSGHSGRPASSRQC
jgi:hypothetical protein